jgi:hypothetical protein
MNHAGSVLIKDRRGLIVSFDPFDCDIAGEPREAGDSIVFTNVDGRDAEKLVGPHLAARAAARGRMGAAAARQETEAVVRERPDDRRHLLPRRPLRRGREIDARANPPSRKWAPGLDEESGRRIAPCRRPALGLGSAGMRGGCKLPSLVRPVPGLDIVSRMRCSAPQSLAQPCRTSARCTADPGPRFCC